MAMKEMRTFKCVNESRNAFWKITKPYKAGKRWAIQVHFGKNGTKGSKNEKYFDFVIEADSYYYKIISQKYLKGYVEVGVGTKPYGLVGYEDIAFNPKPILDSETLGKIINGTWKTSLPPIEQKKKRRMKLGRIL